ncbi:S-layer homology domain-containing protein [Candidatus Peregrinibacteria bacterium]|nr:S-layer homology domain-containing protein [Candidatus Peregrinibacteria bacterium]
MPKEKKPKFKIRKIRKGGRAKNAIKSLFFSPQTIRYFRYSGMALFTILMMFAVYFQQQTGEWFKASVLDAPQPFNGSVLPVSKVPDWTNWGGDNKTTKYSEVDQSKLIDLPRYDLEKMQFPDTQLIWGNASHDGIRNTKITYPVVYLGNYEYDHLENHGSHLAVDIRMPVGTPIHAIANGKVIKASLDSTGFGHHIVIKHIGAPDGNGGTTTIYSNYVHMDRLDVSEGQNVLKGDIIGTSGNTGTSTTPHLHFQIDNDEAPWHPYWPFTWAESQNAGLSFFEAVNASLGMNNARKYTINPMQYVYKYLGSYSLASSNSGGVDNNSIVSNNNDNNQTQEDVNDTENSEPVESTPVVETKPVAPPEPPVVVVSNPIPDSKIDTSLFEFNLIGESVSLVNNGITITAIDEKNQLSKMSDADEIRVEVNGVGTLLKKVFKKSDFNNNAIKIVVNSSSAGISNILIGKSSHQISFVDKVEGIASLRIDHDGYFQKNSVEEVKILAIDSNGNPTPVVNFAGTITIVAKEGKANIIPNRIAVNDFKNGIATIRVTAQDESRIVLRAQNGSLVGESTPIYMEEVKAFADVSKGHPNYEAIKYLSDNGVINGYSDGTFKPNNTVNRVEALKMLMLAFNAGTGPTQELTFTDTSNSEWYSTTLGTAVSKGIVKGYDDGTFRPDTMVNKAEYLKMLFKTNGIELTDTITANPYADVPKDEWYAPYAYMTNRKNLLTVVNNLLKPDMGMTRGEVAETIYRMKYVLDNNLVTYSK